MCVCVYVCYERYARYACDVCVVCAFVCKHVCMDARGEVLFMLWDLLVCHAFLCYGVLWNVMYACMWCMLCTLCVRTRVCMDACAYGVSGM